MNRLYFFIIIFILNCNICFSQQRDEYNIRINYEDLSNRGHITNTHISSDSLYLFFEEGFNKDLVDITVNQKLTKKDTLTTDDAIDLAWVFILPIDKIESIGVRINNGKLLYIEISSKKENKWGINLMNNVLIANKLDYPHAYE